MSAFLITECVVVNRDVFPKCIGEIPKKPMYEKISVYIELVGSGNTTDISSRFIVETIMERLDIIKTEHNGTNDTH